METVKLLGKEVPLEDLLSVTWAGVNSPAGMRRAAAWLVIDIWDNQYRVDPATLADGDKVVLMDVAFPG